MATIRPDSWSFPLLLHVLGAMAMVGALILAGAALVFVWRTGRVPLVRLGYRALLFGALPGWIVMRVGGQWIADKESLSDSGLNWIDWGFTTSDGGIVLIVVSTLLAWLAMRRARSATGAGMGFGRPAALLVGLLLVAYGFTIWAMTTKPT